jgi:hypothetical protein
MAQLGFFDVSFFGYKNHVNADAKHKLIRRYAVTDAAVRNSQELDGLLDTGNINTCNDVFADSAYRSAETKAKLRTTGYKSRIHRRSAQPPAVFGARGSEPRQEPDTRSHRACVRGAAERAGCGRMRARDSASSLKRHGFATADGALCSWVMESACSPSSTA